MPKRQILISLFILVNVVFYQNCGGTKFGSDGPASLSKGTQSNSTGQPYDGKIFAVAGTQCPDGTYVRSRIVMKSATAATVVRDECKDVQREISVGDFSLDPNSYDKIIYGGVTLTKEAPWTPIPVLSSWYYQLTGTLRANTALIQDIDLFETTAAQIQSLKQAGRVVICNISAGTYESWRPDASAFATSDLGNNISGPSERWLDVRSPTVKAALVSRLDLAQSKGCDGVDLDSSDAYENNSGFAISRQDQINYNQSLAFAAHDRRLIVALKNNANFAASMVQVYDFAIAGQCMQYNECDRYQSFITEGKAVLGAEFTALSSVQCTAARASSISLSYFSSALDGSRYETCP